MNCIVVVVSSQSLKLSEVDYVTSQPPRKRGRFENERSDSMSQGEGASKQQEEDGEPLTKAQRQRQRNRVRGSSRKPTNKFSGLS